MGVEVEAVIVIWTSEVRCVSTASEADFKSEIRLRADERQKQGLRELLLLQQPALHDLTFGSFRVEMPLAIYRSPQPEMVKPLREASAKARPNFRIASRAAKATR
jgi:hypothetical protein